MATSSRRSTALRWTGIALAGGLAISLVTLALIDWNRLKGPIERFASARSGRAVSIGGPLDVHVWSLTPSVTVERLHIGNPSWESSRTMLDVERLQAQLKLLPLLKGDLILPRVEITRPRVYLHRDASGRANWTFKNTKPTHAPAGRPPQLPVVRDFLIQDGKIELSDEILRLKVLGTIQAHEKESKDDPKAFRIQGHGTINKQPFEMQVSGGPLINLDPDHPYPFDLEVKAGNIRVSSNGNVRKPFDLGRLQFALKASGSDLADLYYLTQLALPNTPPFQLSANVERDMRQIRVTQLSGKVGESDMSGDLTIDASRKRPAISGDLTSKRLRLKDLAASLGGRPADKDTLQDKTSPPRPSKKGRPEAAPANAKLFPDARLEVTRVRAMDADVKFRGQALEARSLPLKKVALDIKLDNGVLTVSPFEFVLPQGKLSGAARVDARGKTPETHIDARMHNVQLDQLKGKAPDAKPPLGGVLQARATIEGKGDSVHDLMAGANGKMSVILPHGEVRAAFAELTGIDVARGVGLLLKGDNERAEIRCGVAQFDIENGVMRADNVVFDTKDVRISAHGDIKLGTEELDLSIKGEPKKLRMARLRTPIDIRGHLRKPSVGIDTGKTLKQGAIAAALGAVTAPLAAIIAFIDPGLAKDENCATLLAQAKTTHPRD